MMALIRSKNIDILSFSWKHDPQTKGPTNWRTCRRTDPLRGPGRDVEAWIWQKKEHFGNFIIWKGRRKKKEKKKKKKKRKKNEEKEKNRKKKRKKKKVQQANDAGLALGFSAFSTLSTFRIWQLALREICYVQRDRPTDRSSDGRTIRPTDGHTLM